MKPAILHSITVTLLLVAAGLAVVAAGEGDGFAPDTGNYNASPAEEDLDDNLTDPEEEWQNPELDSTLKGTVILEGEPVEGALVMIMAEGYFTDEDGYYDEDEGLDQWEAELLAAEEDLMAAEEELLAREEELLVWEEELSEWEAGLIEEEDRLLEEEDEEGLEALDAEWAELEAEFEALEVEYELLDQDWGELELRWEELEAEWEALFEEYTDDFEFECDCYEEVDYDEEYFDYEDYAEDFDEEGFDEDYSDPEFIVEPLYADYTLTDPEGLFSFQVYGELDYSVMVVYSEDLDMASFIDTLEGATPGEEPVADENPTPFVEYVNGMVVVEGDWTAHRVEMAYREVYVDYEVTVEVTMVLEESLTVLLPNDEGGVEFPEMAEEADEGDFIGENPDPEQPSDQTTEANSTQTQTRLSTQTQTDSGEASSNLPALGLVAVSAGLLLGAALYNRRP